MIETQDKVTPGLYQSFPPKPESFFAKLLREMVLSPELQSNTWKHSYPERLRDRPREAAATSYSGSGNCCQNRTVPIPAGLVFWKMRALSTTLLSLIEEEGLCDNAPL